jgi:hypothetical protein
VEAVTFFILYLLEMLLLGERRRVGAVGGVAYIEEALLSHCTFTAYVPSVAGGLEVMLPEALEAL